MRQDAQALHGEVVANHPGSVNPSDPGFVKRNDAQLKRALKRAHTARTYEDYFYALREYTAAFNDGHFGLGSWGSVATPHAHVAWPGFLTNYDRRGIPRVVVRVDDAPVPLAAQLIGCDGRTAEQLGADILGAQWGRWMLQSQRESFGNLLFMSWGDPYVPHPSRCDFSIDGRRQTVTLNWRSIGAKEASAQEESAQRVASYSFTNRTLANGTRWFSIPSFNANPESAAGNALPPMIAALRQERNALESAPGIVFDLRGNGGGSSDWSYQIAKVLWGEQALSGRQEARIDVDWRVSPANLKTIEDGYVRRGGKDMSAESRRWYEDVIAGLKSALARNAALWRQIDTPDAETKVTALPPPAIAPLRTPVYFVTDANCGSACLDAVDLWRTMGAIHVGRTTSADTLYMEARSFKLPSGLSGGSMPMKVYQGRLRGSNKPVVPVYHFDGDITDTAGLEAWITGLEKMEPGH